MMTAAGGSHLTPYPTISAVGVRTAWYATDYSHGIRLPRHALRALNALRRDILIPVEKILTTVSAGDWNGHASHDSSVRGGGREPSRR